MVRRTRLTDPAQAQLWPDWRYHALATNTELSAIKADAYHRAHARTELAIRDGNDPRFERGVTVSGHVQIHRADLGQYLFGIKHHAGLSHCPSGNFFATPAWLSCATLAHNLYRWVEHHTRPAGRLTNAKHRPHPPVHTARKGS